MVRIITGEFKGHRLITNNTNKVRPTKDRVKESVFNKLRNVFESSEGVVIADLFAGTGNLGFEALSRGAKFCTFIDNTNLQRDIITENAKMLGVEDKINIINNDVLKINFSNIEADLIFADPPYKMDNIDLLFENFKDLAKDTIIVFESSKYYKIPEYFKKYLVSQKLYGYSKISIFRR